MGDRTAISWTEATWNPVTGCNVISDGCEHCYAETIARRFAGTPAYPNGFAVTLRPERLDQPTRWRRPRQIFVCSMADLFHASVPDEYLDLVFDVMESAAQHTFQVLTKRHGRLRTYLQHRADRSGAAPAPNVWVGVRVESQRWAGIRIPALLAAPAAVRFLSCEPMLGPVRLCSCDGAVFEVKRHPFLVDVACPLHGERRIDWVIAGGESGAGARPMHPSWVRALRDQCETSRIPFHFKQWGRFTPQASPGDAWHSREPDLWVSTTGVAGSESDAMAGGSWAGVYAVGKKAAGRELDGRTWDGQPTAEPSSW